jgi:hypothetical protein
MLENKIKNFFLGYENSICLPLTFAHLVTLLAGAYMIHLMNYEKALKTVIKM